MDRTPKQKRTGSDAASGTSRVGNRAALRGLPRKRAAAPFDASRNHKSSGLPRAIDNDGKGNESDDYKIDNKGDDNDKDDKKSNSSANRNNSNNCNNTTTTIAAT